jgi:hypothetical protein
MNFIKENLYGQEIGKASFPVVLSYVLNFGQEFFIVVKTGQFRRAIQESFLE